MKFIELNAGYINVDHIVRFNFCELNLDNGDWVIKIVLSNGEILLEPEVCYELMMKRYNEIARELNGLEPEAAYI